MSQPLKSPVSKPPLTIWYWLGSGSVELLESGDEPVSEIELELLLEDESLGSQLARRRAKSKLKAGKSLTINDFLRDISMNSIAFPPKN
jgi:hypothetical protein